MSMTQGELQSLLVVHGYSCRLRGAEVVLETCTFCGNSRWNLELNAGLGIYSCWVCKNGGRLSQLLHRLTGREYDVPLGDRSQPRMRAPSAAEAAEFSSSPISAVLSASHYVERRGLSAAVLSRYGAVVCTQAGHRLRGRIAIPALEFWTGRRVGWVGRSCVPAQQPKYLSTVPQRMIVGWQEGHTPTEPVALVEGLLDGMAAHQSGLRAAVLGGVGGGRIVQEWAARLHPDALILLMFDGDAQALMQRVYWELHPIHSKIMTVPLEEGVDPAQLGPVVLGEVWRRAVSTLAPTEKS